jgi:hypothetical protein
MGKPRPSRITPEVLEKEARVLELRRGGLTFDMIATRLGYSDASGAHRAYTRACERIVHPGVEEIRKEEQDRLDIAQAAIWPAVTRGEVPSITALVRIMERRARLLGLDLPIRVQQEVTVWTNENLGDELQFWLDRLNAVDTSSSDLGDRPST